ncbi:sodium:solute symporter family protein [Oceanobacillus jeddahense]|uniref:sodium:solute symporter family protein n=1 Tax=Oceanobacillus jeddahense TaxID=1462527 RepID=UPI0005959197|nr:sodium:solute symporter family protein [Oceanobacillus jeddahense]
MSITAYIIPMFIIYFAFIIILGFYHSKGIKNSDDFLVDGRKTGFWVLVGTIVGTNVGGGTMIGMTGEAYQMGVSALWPILPMIVFVLIWTFLFVKYINRIRQVTLPDFLVLRFGESVRIPSALLTMLRSIVMTGMQILAMASIISATLGWDTSASLAFSFIVTVVYCILGGMHTVMVTDAIQTVIQTIGPLLILGILLYSLTVSGSVSQVTSEIDPSFWNLWEPGWVVIFGFIAASGPYYLVYQPMWQRVYSAKDESTAFKSMLWGTIFSFITCLLPVAIGILANAVAPSGIAPDSVLPWMYLEYFPPLIGSFFAVSLIAAIMSVLDSMVLDGSANLVRDVYQKRINPDATNKQLVFMGRIAVVIISTIGLLLAIALPNLIVLWVFANTLAAGGIVIPALAAWFFKKATAKGAFWSIVLGGTGTLGWGLINWWATGSPDTPYFGIHPVYVGFVLSLLALILFSMNSPHSPEENPEATLYKKDDLVLADNKQVNKIKINQTYATFINTPNKTDMEREIINEH